jgi:hypothetical protein
MTTTRQQYQDMCSNLGLDSVEQENAALSIGAEFLPECARAVLADSSAEPAPEYWAWLVAQVSQ